jgi:hypothetical protein
MMRTFEMPALWFVVAIMAQKIPTVGRARVRVEKAFTGVENHF